MDPFLIRGPAVISFSGGRTSGYMLWRILQAHGGTLPADVVVAFANTGKERQETLDFVQACSVQWSVPITWLEWREADAVADRFAVVNHNSASRQGEPFAALIAKRKYLPNQVSRFCTQELKVRVLRSWVLRHLGWARWVNVVGLRADEMHRVRRATDPEKTAKDRWDVLCPLADAGVGEAEVLAFWTQQPFDLGLKSYEGNCDLCFLKSKAKLARIIRENPGISDWWEGEESGVGGTFRPPERVQSYADLRRYVETNASLAEFARGEVFDDRTECETGCTD